MANSVSDRAYFLGYYMQVSQAGIAAPTDLNVNPVWTPGFGTYYLGMFTNAFDVATGVNHPTEPYQVQIDAVMAPQIANAEAVWVFGGNEGDGQFNRSWGSPGVPTLSPVASSAFPGASSQSTVDNLRRWTSANQWFGIDFDDELSSEIGPGVGFDVQNLAQLITGLDQDSREVSYTVLAGSDFSSKLQPYVNLENIWNLQGGAIDRVQLMLYADAMWDKATSDQFVPSSIQAALDLGIPANKIILGATTNGLTSDNLQEWIDSITGVASSYSPGVPLGGLFVWPGSNQPVDAQLMQQIQAGLGVYDPDHSTAALASSNALAGVDGDASNAYRSLGAKGGRYSDIIIGGSVRSRVGVPSADRLIGRGSGDLYVLGVASDQFYDDKRRKDIAVIKNFSLKEADRLQLSGESQDFKLIDDVIYKGHAGAVVASRDGDWIAFLRGAKSDLVDLSLENPYQVVYV